MSALTARLAFAVLAPFLLLGCLLTPGKFTSSLRIDANRNFTFTYKGEVFAADMGDEFTKGLGSTSEDDEKSDETKADPAVTQIALQEAKPGADQGAAAKKAEDDAKYQTVAEALRKEAGYRSVQYAGDGKFVIDYAISGVLDHSFLYPFNTDAEILIPFVAVEVRANDTVRVRAPGFAASKSDAAPPGMGDAAKRLDGTFTLDTDAAIVSQNSEDGAKIIGTRKVISWRATPLLKDAPMAVLKMAPEKQAP